MNFIEIEKVTSNGKKSNLLAQDYELDRFAEK